MYLLLVFLPLFSSISLILFGRLLGRRGAAIISIFTIIFSFLCSLLIFYEVSMLSTSSIIILPNS